METSNHMMHMAQANTLADPSDATHVAVKSGNWSDPDTWAGGKVPGDNAQVYIPENTMVTYDVDSDAALETVRVDGHLKWATSKDTSMLVETIVTGMGSKLEVGSDDNPISANVDATITFRDTKINLNEDPDQLGHGLVAFGEVEIYGAAKESHLVLEGQTNRGDTTIKVDGSLKNWDVGDTILLVGTGDGSRDEERVITGISGDTITLDRALSYSHNSVSGLDMDTYVGNLSRNITFESENPEGTRGHVMLHNDVGSGTDGTANNIWYAAFDDLGRTDSSRQTGTDANPLGRYPIHLHEIGTESDSAESMIVGNAVNGSPGWGITQHSSHASVNNNIVYDTVGAGIISEMGDETGEWNGNLVSSVEGHDIKEADSGHTQVGSEGAAYENQSRVIIQQDNIAANAVFGWNYSGREDFELPATQDGEHRKMFERDQLPFDPSPFDVALDHEEPPIIDFNNNTVIASSYGLRVFHRQTSDDTDTMSVFTNFDVWGGGQAIRLDNYASNYEFVDSVWQGDSDGFTIQRKTSSVVFNNVEFHDFNVGYKSNGLNHEVVMIDTTFEGVKNNFQLNDLMANVTSNSLRSELISYFEKTFGIDYENPMPLIVNSKDLTVVDKVTFTANADADMTIGPSDSILNVTGIITDSVGDRVFNEYVEAKTPKGTGFSKNFEGVSLSFGGGTAIRKEEFTKEEFMTLHGTYQKADGSWVVPVVNWITDRLTADQHPVVIEINVVGYSDEYLKQFELSSYPDFEINNPDWYEANAVTPQPVSGGHDDHDMGSDGGSMDMGSDDDDNEEPVDLGDGQQAAPEEEESVDRDDREEEEDSNLAPVEESAGPAEAPDIEGYTIVQGADSRDRIRAGDEDSILIGDDGRDRMFGGDGNDIFTGGGSRDSMYGGDGADTFIADTLSIDDIFDFSIADGDILDLSEVANAFGLSASEMEDALQIVPQNTAVRIQIEHDGVMHKIVMIRNMDAETFKKAAPWVFEAGAAQALIEDRANEEPADPVVEEPVKDDDTDTGGVAATIVGTNRNDVIEAGSGDDIIDAKGGKDYVYGGAGNDTIDGGEGKNWIYGGSGADDFVFGITALDGVRDEIVDFSLSEGDQFDFSGLASAKGLSASEMMNAVTIQKNDVGARISVEIDGQSYVVAAVHGVNAQDLLDSDALLF